MMPRDLGIEGLNGRFWGLALRVYEAAIRQLCRALLTRWRSWIDCSPNSFTFSFLH